MENAPNRRRLDGWNILQAIFTLTVLAVLIAHHISTGVVKVEDPVPVSPPVSVSPQVSIAGCAFFDNECPITEKDIDYIVSAMQELAALDGPIAFQSIKTKFGIAPHALSRLILLGAKSQKVDPLLITTMAWIESRFNPKAVSDFVKRPQEGKNCGLLQIRTDLPKRPSCESLLDPEANIAWATKYLQDISTSCSGEICLEKYNRGKYERNVWRKVDWLRRRLWLKESR